MRDKEEEERKIKMKRMRSKVIPDEIQSFIVDHVLLHGLTTREVGLQAHLKGFNATYTYSIITVHSSTSDQRTFAVQCTVNTVTQFVHPQTHITVYSFFSTAYTQNLYLSHNFYSLTLKHQNHTPNLQNHMLIFGL